MTRTPAPRHLSRRRALQTFVVRYTEVVHRGVTIDRPLLRGRFTWRGQKWEARSLTDSGADHCFLPKEAADHLGLELVGEPRSIDVVGSSFEAREADVFFQVEERDQNRRPGNPFPLTSILVPTRTGILKEPILGREPFLEGFELTVRQAKREFVLREL